MYKDKDKQREADKIRQRRYRRDKQSATNQGMMQGVTHNDAVCNYSRNPVELANSKRGKDIKVFADLPVDRRRRIIAAAYTCPCIVLGKPGDADYNGVCTDEWIRERKGAAL